MLVDKVTLKDFVERVTMTEEADGFSYAGLRAIFNYLNEISEAGEHYIEFNAHEIPRDFIETTDEKIIEQARMRGEPIFLAGCSIIIHKLGD